jgi:transposase
MAKDDEGDAWLLCELARKHGAELPRWRPQSANIRLLARLTWRRRRAVGERTRLELQLQAELKLAYPVVLELFPEELCRPVAWRFLGKWPSHAELKKAAPAQLRRFFYAQNCRSEKRIAQRLELIQRARALTEDCAAVQSGRLVVLDLARRIATASEGIQEYEEAIAQAMSRHKDARIFQSVPGAGPVFAPRLLAAFGEDRARFKNAQAAQQHFGVAPVRIQSGESQGIYFRRGCSKFLRQTFHEFAGCSMFWCQWAGAYVSRKKKEGKSHQEAVRGLAFKWVRILFRMWQEGSVYDEARILEALQRKGSPYAQRLSPEKKKTLDG